MPTSPASSRTTSTPRPRSRRRSGSCRRWSSRPRPASGAVGQPEAEAGPGLDQPGLGIDPAQRDPQRAEQAVEPAGVVAGREVRPPDRLGALLARADLAAAPVEVQQQPELARRHLDGPPPQEEAHLSLV